MHCLYTKVRQNYFPFEQLSALVYTPRWEEVEMVLLIKACKNLKLAKTKKGEVILEYFPETINKIIHYFYQKTLLQK